MLEIPQVYKWQKNLKHQYIQASKTCQNLFGIENCKDLIGISDRNLPCKFANLTEDFIYQDNLVIKEQKTIKTIGVFNCGDDISRILLTTKEPLISQNRIIGTIGHCYDISEIAASIGKLHVSLTPYLAIFLANQRTKNGPHISSRERECLYYLTQGKSAKETAKLLNLSYRTVEAYLATLKEKLNCRTKTDLILLADQYGYTTLPTTLLEQTVIII